MSDQSHKSRSIVFFLPHLGPGGVERSLFLVAESLANTGHQVKILTVGKNSSQVITPPKNVPIIHLNSKRVVISIPRLARYLRREKPDALIAAQSYANVAAAIASKLARFKGQLILTERLAAQAAFDTHGRLRDRVLPRLMRMFYRRADSIVTNSQSAAADLEQLLRTPKGSVKVIVNSMDRERITRLASEPVDHPWFQSDDADIVITVGRLEPQKDLETMLQAFAAATLNSTTKLVLVGDGSQHAQLEHLAGELGITDRIWFTGFDQNPYKYVAKAKLFVLSSLYEGMPNVLLESQALGIPIVATDAPGGTSEVLEDGRTGVLVEPGDPVKLANAIKEALQTLNDMRQMAMLAEQALNRFDPAESVRQYSELISRD
jgi:glycosyltransferase involved in cell wall biosynthesis